MEYLEGREPLRGDRARAAAGRTRACTIAIQLCDFLEAADRFEPTLDGRTLRSLLHGDLKPRNIRVLAGDEIKVLDFGIAKALSLSRKVTRNDFGSIAYLSPERLESGDVDRTPSSGRSACCSTRWSAAAAVPGGRHAPAGAADPCRASRRRRSTAAAPPGCRRSSPSCSRAASADRYDSAPRFATTSSAARRGSQTHAEREGWPDARPRRAGDAADAPSPEAATERGDAPDRRERVAPVAAQPRHRPMPAAPLATRSRSRAGAAPVATEAAVDLAACARRASTLLLIADRRSSSSNELRDLRRRRRAGAERADAGARRRSTQTVGRSTTRCSRPQPAHRRRGRSSAR